MGWLYPAVEQEVNNIENLKELDPEKQLDYNSAFICILYTIEVMTLLGITTLFKQFFARPRPTMPKEGEPNVRAYDMRSKETNCSMPSGDAAQSALFG